MRIFNKEKQGHLHLMQSLWFHLEKKWRIKFIFLLFLMIIVAFAEVLTIGAVLPFLAAITSPLSLFEHELAQPFINIMGINSAEELLLPLTILFSVLVVIAAFLRVVMIWANSIFAYSSGGELGIEIYRKIMHQPYLQHTLKNSSEVINGILIKTNAVTQLTILPVLTIVSGFFMITSVLMVFVIINPSIALIVYGSFGFMYLLVVKTMGRYLLKNGEHIAHESTKVIKTIQESLEGIRDVIIDNSQEVRVKSFSQSIQLLKKSQGNNEVFGQSPRYLVEAIGILSIAISAYYLLSQNNNFSGEMVAIFGVVALAAQRLLPVVQQVYYAWTNILSSKQSLKDALELLDTKLSDRNIENASKYITFQERIFIKDVEFNYPLKNSKTLDGINLEILKGEKIGIIGETGSGKSTLVDLIMGLFSPIKGQLIIDNEKLNQSNMRSWQSKISHVPQKIYLIDGSISENIAYGVEKDTINLNLVEQAAKQALVDDFVSQLPDKYETNVGENGVLLSGGQRQRIGIARALYKKSEIIILDEATSALDNKTEGKIMDSINLLDKTKTILIIAHRLTTLKKCSKIIKIKNGKIEKVTTYDELISGSNEG
jgi:ATP-binding cassette subfamily B protein